MSDPMGVNQCSLVEAGKGWERLERLGMDLLIEPRGLPGEVAACT